ncbi:MAG: VPS10 domain-containing protein [Bacteroidota bacterium]
MKKLIILFLLFLAQNTFAQEWKTMLYDNSFNVYEVCTAAEKYFETHDKDAKGSGWKTYQRWREENESKYYPTGDRSNVDPMFAQNEFKQFLQENPPTKSFFGGDWVELGPSTIDSITGHYSAGLGRIEDIYIDPANANRLYLGSRSGGFYRSTDGGATWTGTTDQLFASGVNALTARPTNTSNVLINVQNASNQYSHGVYRSNNSGTTWTQTNFNPTNLGVGGLGSSFRVYEIEYHPTIPNLVFIGTNRGIYRSDDDLNTWTNQLTTADLSEVHFHPTNPNIIYAYDSRSSNNHRNQVYISTNAGLTWSLTPPISANGNAVADLSVSAACPDCIYFNSNNGLWKSLDQGSTFTMVSSPGQGSGAFVVSDTDTTVMVTGSIDPFTSTDGGQNFGQSGYWSLGSSEHGGGSLSQNFGQTDVYVHADLRAAKAVNGILYLATDGFMCKSSDNGTTWQILSEGTPIRENYTLGISQSNHFCSMIGSQDNGTSILGEDGWVEFFGADGMEAIIHPLNPDWMMGSFQYGGRRKTIDRGWSQNGAEPSNESGAGEAAWIAPLTYNPNDPFEIYHFSAEVWKSDDFGDNWTELGTPSSFSGGVAESAAIAENNTDIILVSRGRYIERSTDGGQTFTSIFAGLPNASIQDIAFDPKNDDVFAVVYDQYQNNGNKIFITQDAGQTWTNITYNLNNMPLRSVVIDHSNASNIYVGAEIGVFVMPMNGSTWSLYNSGLANMSVREMEINYGSNTLRAATWGRGMWEYALKDRVDYPAILTTEIVDPPTLQEPKEDVDQYITSVISYDGNLSSVFVKWSINTPTLGNTINMNNIVDSTWKSYSPIPDFPLATRVFFKVFAVGSNGDTTETYRFTYLVRFNPNLGINKITKDPVVLFPNPNNGKFTIDLGKTTAEVNVSVLTLDGKSVWENNYSNTSKIDCKLDLSKGNYFVVIQSEGVNSVKKLVVE